MITKEVWMDNIVSSLKEIASEEFQIKGWVENEIHDFCNFEQTYNCLFEYLPLDQFFKQAKDFGLTDIQVKKISDAINAFEKFSEKYGGWEDPLIIVNDLEFPKVRKLAKEALESMGIIHYLDPSKDMLKQMLLSRIHWISDAIGQYRVWILEKSPDDDPLERLMNGFFVTAKASKIIQNYQEYEITGEQVSKLKELYEQLKTYHEKHKNEKNLQKIVDDPEWHKIQALAKDTLHIFDFKPL